MIQDEYLPLLKKVERPGRYTGGEFGCTYKDKSAVDLRMCFCFPDTYEIGMSNLGVKILMHCLNKLDFLWCERAYAPWDDMEKLLRENRLPLYALESGDPLGEFDIVAFTLQYELSYTNAVNMLDLAGIPWYSAERGEDDPLVIGGGPCAYNPEPVAEFFDLFSIGEGEEHLCEIASLYCACRKKGMKKAEFLRLASHIKGTYVPSLYDVEYNEDGTVRSIAPKYEDVPAVVEKRIIQDLDKAPFPAAFEMPYIEAVHDRVTLEVFRGCIRGCRFCQAGMIYRPVREKSPEVLLRQAQTLYANTGYDEISLTSLSISDYTCLRELTDGLIAWTDDKKVSLSLPSLRIDSFSRELMEKVASVRSSSITFAPEAGTQRLRDVINKNVTEEDLMRSVSIAYGAGKDTLKLYFMNGLPTETLEDIKGISDLASATVEQYWKTPGHGKRPPLVTISVSSFVPKPFTPFQWEPQDTVETLMEKNRYLGSVITNRKVRYTHHDAEVSRIEAVLALGDRRLSRALIEGRRRGFRFDAWDEFFDYGAWLDV
ncbi:MAG: TIGR03960 family B12-binding radical SAM protein, partial [Clostridia bacterium]|nr:TIGR03960 family B12-binding radical SAM protein [Clostridia bacterium]